MGRSRCGFFKSLKLIYFTQRHLSTITKTAQTEESMHVYCMSWVKPSQGMIMTVDSVVSMKTSNISTQPQLHRLIPHQTRNHPLCTSYRQVYNWVAILQTRESWLMPLRCTIEQFSFNKRCLFVLITSSIGRSDMAFVPKRRTGWKRLVEKKEVYIRQWVIPD